MENWFDIMLNIGKTISSSERVFNVEASKLRRMFFFFRITTPKLFLIKYTENLWKKRIFLQSMITQIAI